MVDGSKYYIKDAHLSTATTTRNVEENTVSGSDGYIVNIESVGKESK
jgi:hypothetical protein